MLLRSYQDRESERTPCCAQLVRQPRRTAPRRLQRQPTRSTTLAAKRMRRVASRKDPRSLHELSGGNRRRGHGSERVKASENAGMPRKPLTLVAQPPELPQLDLAQGRPTPEEKRHSLIAMTLRIPKLVAIEQREVPWKVLDHLGAASQRPQAPAPYGTLAGLLPSSPNHFRILADQLRVTCISTSLPPPSAQWPVRSTRKRGSGDAMVAARRQSLRLGQRYTGGTQTAPPLVVTRVLSHCARMSGEDRGSYGIAFRHCSLPRWGVGAHP